MFFYNYSFFDHEHKYCNFKVSPNQHDGPRDSVSTKKLDILLHFLENRIYLKSQRQALVTNMYHY